ncbi:uncharacterized protein METZ01_LOCUS316188, partial [marine metagenome]
KENVTCIYNKNLILLPPKTFILRKRH